MSEVKEYKCPSCGAPMYYDIKQKTLSCRFCKNTYDQEYIISHFDEETNGKLPDFDWVKRSKSVWEPYVSDKIEEFECSSCGGKIITRSSTATAKCPFCSHDLIISSDLSGDIRPDRIIPFRITKKEFAEKYTHYISGVRNVPNVFKDKAVLDNITGCYIPVWGYSCTCDSTIDSEFCASINVKDYPILANDKNMGWEVFHSMWPFNLSEAEDFNASYLTGFYASRYTIGAENAMRDADYYIKAECPVKVKKADDNNPVDVDDAEIKKIIHNRELTYYLVPVWLLNIKYVNRTYTIAMNGQTGKICTDDLPENPLYYRWYKIIYLIIQLAELVLGFLYFRRFLSEIGAFSDRIKMIIMLAVLILFVPIIFNLTITSVICRFIFRRKRKKLDPIKKKQLFYVRDFLE
ncbi:hypothetical protein [Ruminococcus flavefaciens]|uniref:hypothetical protein n=1 Tax=Ruminococcus flavefaciens TaxID=1265 RepID=UPI0026F2E1A2|nr:hypothetical protein [Ruminococcus flavefaciens]MDD7516408.1 hypothetical protein [Ruminococcus flavefaciens]MDY5691541.1 hypothetical protein [Ruminococcus flavefaciens]